MAASRPVDERADAVPEVGAGLPPAPRRPSPGPRARPTPHPRVSEEVAPPDAGPTGPADDTAPAPEADPEDAALVAEVAALEESLPAGSVDVWGLVRDAQRGDAEAFGRLYDHYVTMVFRYLYHRVGDRTLAEDFTSETFVRALRRIDSLSFQGRDVGAWLVTIARNIVRDHVKSSRYRLEVSTADMRDADRATEGPEDAVVSRLTHEQLLACVRQLGSEQQECISLRFLQGLSVAETAAVMGKKDGAIKALQHRAVRRLAALLPEGLR
ncbi:sigma-70 family RNA polymerase sigma factor [Trujillonella endophytica]|uniref:RNA polymerase sigma-70 factor, ECF subfamily n=1 Tax=Trujillonella endophytica TaxID=673521 RepID=A0A1H8RHX3_9ACTN|nr:sigma-70 family RNA polymerase sigma factor [Trujillella endophytica]SEO65744.1 RNA polymerase sigma-70 factor, ECF subfamily [Trujillella endophytica]